ncbi:hypothetical protein [Bartonella sp. F02]|uniref:hypothetical protein n=1 Tax=Bartonella sp. F02 TaxID=2967262 RepID=UPI0022A9F387|nr:hypothetical protein [Bartonella sp. F02]MCZ2328885.1 hypothetical protein [Bartonella sp. F02]
MVEKRVHGALRDTVLREKKIRARKKVYRRKLYRTVAFVSTVLFCIVLLFFSVKKVVEHFFFKEETIQQTLTSPNIPIFDARVYCREIAASAVPDMRREVYPRCLNLEKEAYFTVREIWEEISDEVKNKCVALIRPGDGNYFLLRDCLMNEIVRDKRKVRYHF